MNAGRLRHRVTIQEKSVTDNAAGEEIITWSDVATVWAAIEPVRGAEFWEAQQEQAERPAKIVMRYRSDVTVANRLIWGSHTYDIESVVRPAERQIMLEIMVIERL